MQLNFIFDTKIKDLCLPNGQPTDVMDASIRWVIENDSTDGGHLSKYLTSKFANHMSVMGNNLGFQILTTKEINTRYNVNLNSYQIDEVIENIDRYKGKKFYYIIEPYGHIDFFKNTYQGVTYELFEKIKKLNATILINYSHEGHLNDFFVLEILKKLKYKKVIFIYNDYLTNFSNIASKNIKFIKFNYYLNRSAKYFQQNFKENDIQGYLDTSEKQFHFLSFNQWLHHHRTNIISNIFKSKNESKFLISFNPKFYDSLGEHLYDYENQLKDLGFWDDYQYVLSLPEHRVDFDTTLKIVGYGYEDLSVYKKTFISLISDTIFFKKQGFISEKIFKPIMYMQPFLIAAPPLYLQALRDMGFKTFDGFIDESYDLEFDDSKRLSMINQEIQRICSIPIETMKIHLKEIEHILIHNQIKLLTYDFEKAEVDVCKQILDEEYKADLL
jgi:hypothetical protein